MHDTMLILYFCFTVHWLLFQVVLGQGAGHDGHSAYLFHGALVVVSGGSGSGCRVRCPFCTDVSQCHLAVFVRETSRFLGVTACDFTLIYTRHIGN